MKSHQLINQDSGNVEIYTPPHIVEAAHRCMGGIDLDPASSALANERVRAARFFTEKDDGLTLDWRELVYYPAWQEEVNRAKRDITHGRVIGETRLSNPSQSDAQPASSPRQAIWITSHEREQLLTASVLDAESVFGHMPERKRGNSVPPPKDSPRSAKHKPAIEKEKLVSDTSESEVSSTMRNDVLASKEPDLIGPTRIGTAVAQRGDFDVPIAMPPGFSLPITTYRFREVDIHSPTTWFPLASGATGAKERNPLWYGAVKHSAYESRPISPQLLGLRPVRVFQNHPFSREHNASWINKLVSEYEMGHISAACAICFASTSEKWFRPLLDFPQCFLSPRTNYLLPDGTVYRGVTKGSVVTYMGDDVAAFAREFSSLGVVKVAY